MKRGTGGDAGFVGVTGYLEVVVLVEVIASNRFVEPQFEIVAYAEYGIGGFGFSEYAWRARILDTAYYFRRAGDKSVTVAAESYGAEVVLLLHRVALAIEPYVLDTAAVDHRLVARSELIEAVLGVVGAEVHPVLVAAGSEFVLELDMVEVLVVDIKSVDHNRQIPSCRVLRREGVHDPVGVRSGDIHGAGYRHIMDGEGAFSQFGQRA